MGLTFVLQRVVCGLQHGLVEVLSEGLWCESLPGPTPPVLHRVGLLPLVRRHSAVLEALKLLGWLTLHESRLVEVGGQGPGCW